MECACEIHIEHDGGPEYSNIKFPKARKTHQCGECYRDILPGEKYEKITAKWDGDFSTHKTCLDCRSIRDQFFTSWMYGQIWEHLDNFIADVSGEISESCIAELTPMAREKVCEKIELYWEYPDE